MKKSLLNYSTALLIVLSWVAFHYSLLRTDATIMRDDSMLLSAVDSVVSVDDYISKLFSGYFYDIQPVRDLTFAININLFKWFGYGGYHLMNLCLGGLIIFYFRKLLIRLNVNEVSVNFIVILIALHPVFNSTMAWVSNRKHLLAIYFILLYLIEVLKSRPSELKSLFFVILSLLSQPITVFIPILISLDKIFFRKIRLSIFDILIGSICLLSVGVNYYFYHTNVRFAGRNFVDSFSVFGDYILRFCRVPIQLFFPLSVAVEYDLGNILSYVGIPLSVLILYLAYKFAGRNLRVFFLFMLPLSTLFPVMNWGVRDAYLLSMILVSMTILVIFLKRFDSKYMVPGLCIYMAFFSFYSIKYTKMWINDVELFRVSYENEGGIQNLLRYGDLLGKYKPNEAYDIFQDILKVYPHEADSPGLRALKAEYLYHSPKYSFQEKIKMFGTKTEVDIFEVFFLSKLYKDMGDSVKSKKAWDALKGALKTKHNEIYFSLALCQTYVRECDELGLRFRGEKYSSVLPGNL